MQSVVEKLGEEEEDGDEVSEGKGIGKGEAWLLTKMSLSYSIQ